MYNYVCLVALKAFLGVAAQASKLPEVRRKLQAVKELRGEESSMPKGFLEKEREVEESEWAVTEQVQDLDPYAL